MEERADAENIGKPANKGRPVDRPNPDESHPGVSPETYAPPAQGGVEEELGAPPSSPHAEEAGRHGGELGETPTGAPGLRGGPGPGPAPGMAAQATTTPPEGEASEMEGCRVRMTEHIVQLTPEECAKRKKEEKDLE